MNTKDKINKILADEQLTLVGKTTNDIDVNHHSFYSIAKNKKGERNFFKFLTSEVDFKKETFKKELLLLKFLSENNITGISVPSYIKGSFKEGDTWLVRELGEGDIFGDRLNYSDKFYTPKTIQLLESFITSLQKNTPAVSKFFKKNKSPLQTKKTKWFLKNFQKDHDFEAFYKNVKEKIITPEETKKINKFIKKHSSLLNKNLVLTHGDLQAENIIFDNNGDLIIIDWENIHLNNRLFDWGYIWVNSWNSPKWRKQLEKKITSTEEDKILFTINKIRWLTRMIGLMENGVRTNTKNKPIYLYLKKIKDTHISDLRKIIKNL